MTPYADYLDRSAAVIAAAAKDAALQEALRRAIDLCVAALRARAPILVCGNGGSAADAMHLTAELVGRFKRERKGLDVIALTGNPATITAWANDYDYDSLFARQVEAHGRPEGVLIGISTSGNSKNVVQAAQAAREMEMHTVALTGEGGGTLASHADVLLAAPSRDTPIIQQVHLCLYHLLCEHVEAAFAEASTSTSAAA